MDRKEILDILENFIYLLNESNKDISEETFEELKNQINRKKRFVQNILFQTHCNKKMTINPPRTVGGNSFSIDPMENIFNTFYGYDMGIKDCIISSVQEAIGVIELNSDFKPNSETKNEGYRMDNKKDVFIVHGHKEDLKHETARIIQQLGLNPIILSEQASKSQTVIEKLENNSDVGYAVILMSPDDKGKKRNTWSYKYRARQNVIAELGYFIAKLGRQNVYILKEDCVEWPSDFTGIVYKNYSEKDWKLDLCKNLKAAGFDVSSDRIK